MTLETALSALPKVGDRREAALERLGLRTIAELLAYFPKNYEDRTLRESIAALPLEESVCVSAVVSEPLRTSYLRSGLDVTKGRIADHTGELVLTFFNQAYVRQTLHVGMTCYFYGKLTQNGGQKQLVNPFFEEEGRAKLNGGIVPVYPLTAGITAGLMRGWQQTAAVCVPQIAETLPSFLREKYALAPVQEAYAGIHFPESWTALQSARRRLIFEELFCLSLGLSLLRSKRVESAAIAFQQQRISTFLEALPFTLTKAQRRAVDEAAADLAQERPMNRLLQGDVGSGKTVVAAACVFLAKENGCQAAFMAPTELLAQQHFRTMNALFAATDIRIGLLTGSMTAAQKRHCREALELGELDLLVGTHALLSESVTFPRLGLVITDEQHRFGVGQRAALSAKGGEAFSPHVLAMSATPIPRTLALMVYGDLELSIIDELPPGRTPVATYLVGEDKRQRMYGFLRKQVSSGRQVYIVCPAVSEEDSEGMKAAEQMGQALQREIFPELRVAVVHGKLKPKEKEAVMERFSEGVLDILVSTTVIEVGVDVPNANLIIVENADRFGLSQLHQLRGRVGRGQFESYCILVSDHRNEQTRKRLKTLTKTNDGFLIAEEDLKLRGPGDFFGARQHGLPQLKLASLETDMRLLHEAQDAAKELLQDDPKLEKAEHGPLKRRIETLFAETGSIFN